MPPKILIVYIDGQNRGNDNTEPHAYAPDVCNTLSDQNKHAHNTINSLTSFNCDTLLLSKTTALDIGTYSLVSHSLINLLNLTCRYITFRKQVQHTLPVCINMVQNLRWPPELSTMTVTVHNGTIVSSNQLCDTNWIGLAGCCYQLQTEGYCQKSVVSNQTMCNDIDLSNQKSALAVEGCMKMRDPVYNKSHHTVEPVGCGKGQYTCDNGDCVSEWLVHDGDKDCLDGTDESDTDTICHTQVNTWSAPTLQCGHRCMPGNCTCEPHYYHCLSGGCIPWHLVCDGHSDCEGSTDELHCTLLTNNTLVIEGNNTEEFSCKTFNINIDGSLVSDGIPDCPWFDDVMYDVTPVVLELPWVYGADDESQTTDETENLQCNPGTLPCKYTTHLSCFPLERLCVYDKNELGRLKFCSNGGHLTSCVSMECVGLFKCPLSYCLPLRLVCDGVSDCPWGEDEDVCSNPPLLCPGMLRCKGGGCIHPVHVCDGHVDCGVMGEDEAMCDRATCPPDCQCFSMSMVCNDTVITFIDATGFRFIQVSGANEKVPEIHSGDHLYYLDLSHNKIQTIKYKSFLKSPFAIHLNLSHNRISELADNCFAPLILLRELYLYNNKIMSIGRGTFQNLYRLSILDISNSLNVAAIILNIRELSSINISKSSIETITLVFDMSDSLMSHFDLSISTLTTINISGFSHSTFTLYTDLNAVCCIMDSFAPGLDCSSTQTLIFLCPTTKPINPTWYIGAGLLLCSLWATGARLAIPKMTASVSLLSLNVAGLLTGISIILMDIKDSINTEETVPSVGDLSHGVCMLAAMLQYTSIGVQTLMTPITLYSLHVVIQDWSKPKAEVARTVHILTTIAWVHILLIIPLVAGIKYQIWGTHINLGGTCSILFGSNLGSFDILPSLWMIVILVFGGWVDFLLLRQISNNIDVTKRGLHSFDPSLKKGTKTDGTVIIKLVKKHMPCVILSLSILVCVIVGCSMSSEADINVSYPLIVFVFPVTSVVNIGYAISDYRQHL